MNNSLKGAFLSGLVFPGFGQVILKHYKRGAVLMLAVSAGMLVILIKALQQAFAIMEKIASGGSVINLSTISKAATEASRSPLFVNLSFPHQRGMANCCWPFTVTLLKIAFLTK